MKIDAETFVDSPSEAIELSRQAEAFGFDGFWVNETKHDPFIQLALAAANTKTISIGTSIALAFTRSPTTLAYTAWDLQNLSQGRMILGLGSQVKGHIERRFGMKWECPAPKMREVVLALRAIWEAWQTGGRLEFKEKFFTLDLMTPFFSPSRIEHPAIPIFVAGVNEGMCRMVGEIGDGLHVHPLHTSRYLREVVAPALESGLRRSGRKRVSLQVAASAFVAVGETESEIRGVREAYRSQIAFYASTRTYRRVMELHGWGDICDRLHEQSVRGEWDKMPAEVSEDVMNEFVLEGTWSEVGERVVEKYGGLVDRVRLYLPFDGAVQWKTLVAGFHE